MSLKRDDGFKNESRRVVELVDSLQVAWSADDRAVAVTGTFLPLGPATTVSKQPCGAAVVRGAGGHADCLIDHANPVYDWLAWYRARAFSGQPVWSHSTAWTRIKPKPLRTPCSRRSVGPAHSRGGAECLFSFAVRIVPILLESRNGTSFAKPGEMFSLPEELPWLSPPLRWACRCCSGSSCTIP